MQTSRALAGVASLLVFLSAASPHGVLAQRGPAEGETPELRALWVDAFHDGFKTPRQVDQLVNDARRANFNTLIVQVRRRADAYFLNRIEPRTEDPDLAPGFDALQYLLDRARAQEPRLEVHAWIGGLSIWSKRDVPPRDPEHVFNRRGPNAEGADFWMLTRDDGETWAGDYLLDPGHPSAVNYLAEVAAHLVRNYDIDGLHLDRIRYPEGDSVGGGVRDRRWGYNPTSVARFNERHGRAGTPDPNDPEWAQWRRDQVTGLVRRIYEETISAKPHVKVSAAVIPWGRGPSSDAEWLRSSAYTYVFQDWRRWLVEGWIDFVVTMNYFREEQPVQREGFDSWGRWQKDLAHGRQVVIGLGAYLNGPSEILDQVQRARAPSASGRRPAGVALYSYAVSNRTLANDDPEDDLGTSSFLSIFATPDPLNGGAPPFASPVPPPDMPWKRAAAGATTP